MLYHNKSGEQHPWSEPDPLLPKALNQNDRIVLTALHAEKRPLSAYAILDKTRSSAIRAPSQVYRSLQRLEDHGLVHRIEALSAFVACSDRRHGGHEPAFAICRGCGSVREFEATQLREIAREAAGPRFAVDSVSVEIFGTCEGCGA